MSNNFFTATGKPTLQSRGLSSDVRSEFAAIEDGFDKLPTITGNGGKLIRVNAGATALEATSAPTGLAITGSTVDSSVIGGTTPAAITGTTITGTTITATTGFSGPLTGAVSGNVTGNVTGNLAGNVTGTLTGNVVGNVTASSGSSTFTDVVINGGLDMTSGTISNLAAPSAGGDAVTKTYADTQDALRLALTGGTMAGSIAMGSNKITGLGTPTVSGDAATKDYVDAVNPIGKQSLWLPVEIFTMDNSTTAPSVSGGSSGWISRSYGLAGAAPSGPYYATFILPRSWNAGGVTARVVFSPGTSSTNGLVLRVAIGSASAGQNMLSGIFGSSVDIIYTPTAGTWETIQITGESSTITVGNTPAKGDVLCVKIDRNYTHASDVNTTTIGFIGVMLYYTTDAATDA